MSGPIPTVVASVLYASAFCIACVGVGVLLQVYRDWRNWLDYRDYKNRLRKG